MLRFFKQIFQAESPVSSRRIIAFWFAFVILSFIVYKGVNETNAIEFIYAFLVFMGGLLGLTTAQNIVSKVQNSITERADKFQKRAVGGDKPPKEDEEIQP